MRAIETMVCVQSPVEAQVASGKAAVNVSQHLAACGSVVSANVWTSS